MVQKCVTCVYWSYARLAQLVEHPLDVGRVRGSSPLSRTKYINQRKSRVSRQFGKSVKVGSVPVLLTPAEYKVLEILSLYKGKVIKREMFLNYIYGGISEPNVNAIDKFISNLRKKIANTSQGERYIESRYGGYSLMDPK